MTRSLGTMTRAYIGALSLVALLSIMTHFGLMLAIVTQNGAAATINLSGRQRMLSQRIALFGQELVSSSTPDERQNARTNLLVSIDLMRASHQALINGDPQRKIAAPATPAINAVYFDAPLHLDTRVQQFLAVATKLAQASDRDLTPDNPDLRYLVSEASAPLLDGLDQAVQQYQRYTENEINRLQFADNVVLWMTLVVLIAEGVLIFRPLARRMATEMEKLRDAEAYTRSILDHAPHGILTVDSKGAITSLNPSAERLFGYTGAADHPLTLQTLFPPHVDRGTTHPLLAVQNRDTRSGETWGVRQNGEVFLVEWSSSALDRQGQRTYVMMVLDNSERQQAERQLQRERDFAQQILNSMGQGVTLTDTTGRFTYVNPAYAKMVGYEPDMLIGKSPADMTFGEDMDAPGAISMQRGPGKADTFEMRLRRADTTPLHALITVVPLYVEAEVAGTIAVISNLSERKRAEQRLRTLYDITASWHMSFDRKIQALLEMGCREFELDIGVLARVEDQRYTIAHAVDRDAEVKAGLVFAVSDTYCGYVLRDLAPVAVQYAAITDWRDRSCYAIFHLEAYIGAPVVVEGQPYGTLAFSSKQPRTTPFRDEDKEFLRLMAQWVGGEVQRREAEQRLRASEAELRALFSAMTDVILVLDRDGRYLKVAPTATSGLADQPDYLTGKLIHDVFPADADALVDAIRRALDMGHTITTDYRLDIAGTSRWFAAAVSPMTETSVVWVARDITERNQAQALLVEALEAAEWEYYQAEEARRESRAVLDATSEAMALISPGGEFLSVNRRFEAMFALPAASTVGRSINDVWPQLQPLFAIPHELHSRIVESIGNQRDEWSAHLAQHLPEPRDLDLYSTPVTGRDGVHRGRLYVFRDVSREREAERMKDEFVSLVSHELRTPMTSVKGFVDLIVDQEAGPINELQRDFLGIVQRNADRMIGLINDLLDMSRLEAGKLDVVLKPLNLAPLVAHVAAALRVQIETKGQHLHLHTDPLLPPVLGDHDRLTQVVTNLLSNAHKYTPGGGTITITLASVGTKVQLAVQDTGIGLTAEDQAQVFTKFFRARNSTTQEVGGTGLGLAIVRGLVEMHGGTISVASAIGVGSTFTVLLPMLNGHPATTAEPAATTVAAASFAGSAG